MGTIGDTSISNQNHTAIIVYKWSKREWFTNTNYSLNVELNIVESDVQRSKSVKQAGSYLTKGETNEREFHVFLKINENAAYDV